MIVFYMPKTREELVQALIKYTELNLEKKSKSELVEMYLILRKAYNAKALDKLGKLALKLSRGAK